MEEIWKEIPEFPGYYVSNLGNIKSFVKSPNGHIIKPAISKTGYYKVTIKKGNSIKDMLIHRLIAMTFIENPMNYPCVNHKDENKSNNKVSNLEWCDYKYNTNYGTCIARTAEGESRKVFQVVDNKVTKIFKSLTEASSEIQAPITYLSTICNGGRNHRYKRVSYYYEKNLPSSVIQ